ncbi:hypothetical protein [Streptomyces sp. JH34]|uniref:hypothetical protein n=1 Tax=Streptomyces sp. JH34 TaxID=2793633 RepID=UPI0023F798EC|nr:hypothetical protein [Streptomyces sp. JH34]MDF6019219.1 hypothetical protein [Streptomyces sp. JH34]
MDSPVGVVRRRLRDKLPPLLPAAPASAPDAPGTLGFRPMVECTQCGTPGRPEALPDGLCRSCRTSAPADTTTASEPPAERDVATYVGTLRELLRSP